MVINLLLRPFVYRTNEISTIVDCLRKRSTRKLVYRTNEISTIVDKYKTENTADGGL